jgi:hypothetical protein
MKFTKEEKQFGFSPCAVRKRQIYENAGMWVLAGTLFAVLAIAAYLGFLD